jgi:hypothetical protein
MRRVYGGKVTRLTLGGLFACLDWLPKSRDVGMGGQKSAEGIVAAAHGGEGPNMEDRKGAYYLVGRRRRRKDG